MTEELIIIRSQAEAITALSEIGASPVIAFDFETTGLDQWSDEIWGLSLCGSMDKSYWFPKPFDTMATQWFYQLTESEKFIVGHNIKFDWHFMNRFAGRFVDITTPIDTMVMAWLVNENRDLGLKPLAEELLGETDLPEYSDFLKEAKIRLGRKRMDQVHISDLDQEQLGKYGAKDSLLTYRLYMYLYDKLVEEEQFNNFFVNEVPFTSTLAKMEWNGIWVDLPGLKDFKHELEIEFEKANEHWATLTGGVNQNSSKQLQELFYDKLNCPVSRTTKGGKPSTDALTLLRLRGVEEAKPYVEALTSIREVEKLLNTYVIPIIIRAEANGGWLRGSFNQTGTVTGRLSSSDPNLQNIPIRTPLGRRLRMYLGAPPGYKYLGVDYSQIELRLIAHYSKSPTLLEVFLTEGDPHQTTADMVNVERHIGKTINFAWAYGSGPRTLCNTIEENGYDRPDEADAKQWLNNFGEAYPELGKLKQQVIIAGLKRGYIKTIIGRRRHLPDLKHYDNKIRSRAERQGPNSLIQGSVGDLMMWVMNRLVKTVEEKFGAKLCLQVHDELGFIVPDSSIEKASEYVQEVMESIENAFNLTVPIKADPKFAQFWGEAH